MAQKRIQQSPRSTMVPVTTMEEIPVFSKSERADLIKSLEEAEARIEAGEYVDYDPKTFKNRLLSVYRNTKSKA